jgi:hypothetical protein
MVHQLSEDGASGVHAPFCCKAAMEQKARRNAGLKLKSKTAGTGTKCRGINGFRGTADPLAGH